MQSQTVSSGSTPRDRKFHSVSFGVPPIHLFRCGGGGGKRIDGGVGGWGLGVCPLSFQGFRARFYIRQMDWVARLVSFRKALEAGRAGCRGAAGARHVRHVCARGDVEEGHDRHPSLRRQRGDLRVLHSHLRRKPTK